MVPLNTTAGRAPARGRRPQDAPRLSAVPSGPVPGPDRDAAAAPAGLPDALAHAVLGSQAPPKAAPKAPAAGTDQSAARAPAPAPERDQAAEPTAPKDAPTSTDTPTETSEETALVAVESPSAAEAERAIKWLGVTFRPPDVWRERQPSLREEWAFVMDGSHLPEEGLWRALARGYAAPAIGVITVLHFLTWVLRSPARHATAWVVAALIAVSAALML
ncbi:hypothetical protein [Nocardiopsis sp. NRRL B-16309]|uniref:hypothetical protein n=1 Tax=Nocardiopsis sp. NRRL B-16309 TaxID=1519494 RepID=UPI0006AE0364|nr:hypothetical protein [Nocardiopsis sp. NRRL B-16309]KOX18056.1 hypothetical protein ADL05_08055 [Nocardiopsis sp. NRRL B-16309]